MQIVVTVAVDYTLGEICICYTCYTLKMFKRHFASFKYK